MEFDNNFSKEFMDVVFQGLDHGMNSIIEGGPLVPFILCEDIKGGKKLDRFVAEKSDQSIEMAKKYLKEINPTPIYSVLVYEGLIIVKNTQYPCIIAKSFDSIAKKGVMLAQRYIVNSMSRKNESFGNPVYLEKLEKFEEM